MLACHAAARVRFPADAVWICSSDSCLKWRSCVLRPVLSAHKISQCLTEVRMSGPPLSPKFPTVALQWSKSSVSVHSGGRIETSGTCFNIHSMSLSIYLSIYIYPPSSLSLTLSVSLTLSPLSLSPSLSLSVSAFPLLSPSLSPPPLSQSLSLPQIISNLFLLNLLVDKA